MCHFSKWFPTLAGMIAMMSWCSVTAAQKPSTSVDEQLQALDQKWVEAEKVGDSDFLSLLFADNYEMVNTQGDGLTKEQMLASLKSPNRDKLDVARPENIQVHIYGKLAIVNDQTAIEGHSADGKEIKGTIYSTRILVRTKGKWRAVHEQEAWMKPPVRN